jgi:hypothetical protein
VKLIATAHSGYGRLKTFSVQSAVKRVDDGTFAVVQDTPVIGAAMVVDHDGFAASYGTRSVPTNAILGSRRGCCGRRSRGPEALAEILDRA